MVERMILEAGSGEKLDSSGSADTFLISQFNRRRPLAKLQNDEGITQA